MESRICNISCSALNKNAKNILRQMEVLKRNCSCIATLQCLSVRQITFFKISEIYLNILLLAK